MFFIYFATLLMTVPKNFVPSVHKAKLARADITRNEANLSSSCNAPLVPPRVNNNLSMSVYKVNCPKVSAYRA